MHSTATSTQRKSWGQGCRTRLSVGFDFRSKLENNTEVSTCVLRYGRSSYTIQRHLVVLYLEILSIHHIQTVDRTRQLYTTDVQQAYHQVAQHFHTNKLGWAHQSKPDKIQGRLKTTRKAHNSTQSHPKISFSPKHKQRQVKRSCIGISVAVEGVS